MEQKRITIIGGGFAALTAARRCRALDSRAEITVIAPQREFVFLPSLIWLPSGIRRPDDLRIPLARFYARYNVIHHQGSATGLRNGGRVVETSNGDVENDGLIIACGGRFIKKLPGIKHVITPCEGIDAVMQLSERLQAMEAGTIAIGFGANPKEPSAMRGGPMFEFLFSIDRQLRSEGRRGPFRLVFFSPAAEPGKRMGAHAVTRLLKRMDKLNIETHLGHALKGFEKRKVITKGGEFEADLILFMPGMTGNTWLDKTDLPRSEGGLIQADRHCAVPGFEHVYVAGDSGSFPGPEWMPKQAHMADLQGSTAASNLIAGLERRRADATFKVELLCIIDDSEQGMLVMRTLRHSFMLPSLRLGHWCKRLFERLYLLRYRR